MHFFAPVWSGGGRLGAGLRWSGMGGGGGGGGAVRGKDFWGRRWEVVGGGRGEGCARGEVRPLGICTMGWAGEAG